MTIAATIGVSISPRLAADGNLNNQIDAGDDDVWKANFGAMFGAGSGSVLFAPGESAGANDAIPEPSTLAAIGLLGLVASARRTPQPTPSQSRQ